MTAATCPYCSSPLTPSPLLEVRKATLASILAKASHGIRFNEHIEGDGPSVFAHACKLGLEGIVSKRKGSILSQSGGTICGLGGLGPGRP
jgi:ATP-dependent DNA ligase